MAASCVVPSEDCVACGDIGSCPWTFLEEGREGGGDLTVVLRPVCVGKIPVHTHAKFKSR